MPDFYESFEEEEVYIFRKEITSDAYIKGAPVKTIISDMFLGYLGQTKTITSDIWIKEIQSQTIDSDAYIKKLGYEGSINSDLFLGYLGQTKTLSSDSYIKRLAYTKTMVTTCPPPE